MATKLLANGKNLAKGNAWVLSVYGHVELAQLHYFLQQSGTYSTQNVIKKEFLRAPYVFYHAAKHPQSKHVAEDMHEIGMQEEIANELIEVEVISHKEM